jgi:hypothetical protein
MSITVETTIPTNLSDLGFVEQDLQHIDVSWHFLAPAGAGFDNVLQGVKRRALNVRETTQRRKTRQSVQNRARYSDILS